DALLEVSGGCGALRDWTRRVAPSLAPCFAVGELARLPAILARESTRRWLTERGVSHAAIDPDAVARLIEMAADAATPARQQFEGGVVARRRGGHIEVEPS